MLSATQVRHDVVAKQPSVFIVEMYTPGEIVEARRSFGAATATDALRVAMGWINDSGHNAIRFRVVNTAGTIACDKPVAKLK
jgi:hypothetical protein